MRAQWHGIETPSDEALELDASDSGVYATSTVSSRTGGYQYEVRMSPTWVFTELNVRDDVGTTLLLSRSQEGAWIVDGTPRPHLSDAVDIDLSFSPFTNTLPIRRLALRVGESRDIVAAYVTAELDVMPDPQRYTRLAEHRYLYESRDSDFRRDLTVDDDGLIVDYPGLFRRS